jgi:hypothetical protein
MSKTYTPSKIKSIIKSGNLARTTEMVKSPEFPKEMMVDILSKEAPTFTDHHWEKKIHHAPVMAEMIDSKHFTDEEVEQLLNKNPALKMLSFYSERISKEHFLESLKLRLNSNSFNDISMWLIVRHRHFPMNDAYNLVDEIENSIALTAIATECTNSDALEKLFNLALTKSTDVSNCIMSALAGNKHLPEHIVAKFFE